MLDRTTRLTLIAIALGLWANVFAPILAPKAAHADDDDSYILSQIQQDISNMASDISDIYADIHEINNGSCSNNKIC